MHVQLPHRLVPMLAHAPLVYFDAARHAGNHLIRHSTMNPSPGATELHMAAWLRAALWLLSRHPGMGGGHVAVLKAVTEAFEALLSRTTVRPAFVRALLPPLLLRSGERRGTAAAVQSLLLSLTAASSPRTVQRVIAAHLPTANSARLVEPALALLALCVDRFGASALSPALLLPLIRQAAEDSQPTVRAALVHLLTRLYAQLGLSFKAPLLSLVGSAAAPAVSSALQDWEEEGRGWGEAAEERARGEDGELVKWSVDSVFPKVELSGRLLPSTLHKLRSAQWRERLEGLEEVSDGLRALNQRATLKDGTVLPLLAGLLHDVNKAIQHSAFVLLSALLLAVPEALHRHREYLLPPLLQATGDARKAVREEATRLLDAWIGAVGLAGVMKPAVKAMEGGVGRGEVMAVLAKWRALDAEWTEAIPVVLDGLCDKSGQVRAASERLLEAVVDRGGAAAVAVAVNGLKAAYQLQVQPLLERLTKLKREADRSRERERERERDREPPLQSARLPPSSTAVPPSLPQSREPERAALADGDRGRGKAKLNSQKRKAAESTAVGRQSREEADAEAVVSLSVGSGDPAGHPFLVCVDPQAKARRLLKDSKRLVLGAFREWSADEREDTSACLASLVSPALHSDAVSQDFTRQLTAVHFFLAQLRANPSAVHCVSDVVVRWAAQQFSDANPKLLLALLGLLQALLASFARSALRWTEPEMGGLLPSLIERGLGHSVKSVRREAAALLLELPRSRTFSAAHTTAALLAALDSRNKRAVSDACDCLAELFQAEAKKAREGKEGEEGVRSVGAAMWAEMRRGLPLLAGLLSTSDSAVRLAALSAIVSCHGCVGEQMWPLLQRDGGRGGQGSVSDKALSLIEERLRRVKLDSMALHPTPAPVELLHLPTTPLKGSASALPSQLPRTPLSSSVHCSHPQSSSPGSGSRHGRHGRTPSRIPTLSSLSSSLASLEAMQASLTSSQEPRHSTVPHLLMALQGGAGDDAQLQSLHSLAALVRREGVDMLLSHSSLVLRGLVRLFQRGGLGFVQLSAVSTASASFPSASLGPPQVDEGRREALSVLRSLVAHPSLVSTVAGDDAGDLVEAVLAFTARQLQCSRGDAVALRNDGLACCHALLDSLPPMRHFTQLTSLLLHSIAAAPAPPPSPASPLPFLLQGLLLRWSSSVSSSDVDVFVLLSSLHRLFLALPTSPSPLLSALHALLHSTVGRCDASRVSEVLKGFPLDAPIVGLLRSLIGVQDGEGNDTVGQHGEDGVGPAAVVAGDSSGLGTERPLSRPLKGRKSRQLYAAVVREEDRGEDGAVEAPPVTLQQLLQPQPQPTAPQQPPYTPPTTECATSSSSSSYLERFHALQSALRGADPLTSLPRSLQPPLSPSLSPRAPPQHSPPRLHSAVPLRCSPSQYGASPRSPSPVPLSASSSAAVTQVGPDALTPFEALRVRMKLRGGGGGGGETAAVVAAQLRPPQPSLSSLLHRSTVHPSALPSPADSPVFLSSAAFSSVSSVGAVLAASFPSPPQDVSATAGVSALRARLANMNAANRAAAL